jgi:hypothetical protein
MNKDCVVEDALEALSMLDGMGIAVDGYVITDPSYGLEEFKRTREIALDWVTRFPCLDIFFTIKTPFPGTVLYKQVRKQIVQNNYDLFDVFHAVVPTRLPAEEFYLHFARLWEEVLSHSRMGRSKKFNARELHSFCNIIANGWVAHDSVPAAAAQAGSRALAVH